MSKLILKDIKSIYGQEDKRSASILIMDGKIEKIGAFTDLKIEAEVVDCSNLIALPGFVDCHTHLVFAGTREKELYMRAAGRPYLDILKSGGGIYNTVRAVHEATEDELFLHGMKYLDQALELGITTVEIKSGYGLDYDNELKMLKAIRRLQAEHPVDVVITYLVHSVPKNMERDLFLDEVETRMIPDFRAYADWFDIFLEKGVFGVDESRRLIKAAKAVGYKIGFHTNQVNDLGGVKLAVEVGARHIDHLEVLSDEDADLIRNTEGLYPVFLPTAEGFVFSEHTGQIDKLGDLKDRIVLSSDFNPGSSPVLSPLFVIAQTVLRYRVSDPGLLLDAYTKNPAAMLGFEDRGRIDVGMAADLVLLELDNFEQVPYLGTFNFIRHVIKNGIAPMGLDM